MPLLLQRSSAPVRLLTLDQVRMRVDGRAVRLDTIKEVLESVLRDVPRRDDDVLVRRMVTVSAVKPPPSGVGIEGASLNGEKNQHP